MKKILVSFVLLLVIIAVPLSASAATNLTTPQINAIIGLLIAFGADVSVVESVRTNLSQSGSNGTDPIGTKPLGGVAEIPVLVDLKVDGSDGPITVEKCRKSTPNSKDCLSPRVVLSWEAVGVGEFCTFKVDGNEFASTDNLTRTRLYRYPELSQNSAYIFPSKSATEEIIYSIHCTGVNGIEINDSVGVTIKN